MSTYVVDTRQDVVDASDGVTSLREALALAQAHEGADTIIFDAGVFTAGDAAITLTQGALAITQAGGPVTIQGDIDGNATPDVVLDAHGQSGVLVIAGASESQRAEVSLEGLTVTGGSASGVSATEAELHITESSIESNRSATSTGGGISLDGGALTITRSTITGNSAYASGGGIAAADADLTVVDSRIIGNTAGFGDYGGSGGGIWMDGGAAACVITGSSISGNAAGVGYFGGVAGGILMGGAVSCTVVESTIEGNGANAAGGIASWGDLTVVDSLIAGNSAGSGNGGGVGLGGGTGLFVNTTLTGNNALGGTTSFHHYLLPSQGGAIDNNARSLALVNCTVVNNITHDGEIVYHANLGAISGRTCELNNSIVAGNKVYGYVGDYYPRPGDISSRIVSNGHNLFSQTGIAGARASDIVVAPDEVFTSVLGELADNGGPTRTHALLPGSAAIDAGANADALDVGGLPLTTDQRGEPRIVGDVVDIGAVEWAPRTVVGTPGPDSLAGGPDSESISGLDGADTITGGLGNDTVDGGTGADSMRGGAGDDLYRVDNAQDIVDESGTSGVDTVESTVSWTLGAGFENLILKGAENISGTGNGLANVLAGAAGANLLQGLGGADTITGGLGNDTVDGGAGADSMRGGAGDDLYRVDNAQDIVDESGTNGLDTVESTVSWTLAEGVENLTLKGAANISGTGSGLANALTGNAAANKLVGLGGGDTIVGWHGDDTLIGGAGDDRLYGGTGNDRLFGGAGNDLLSGHSGADLLRGESGNDVFDYNAATDSSVLPSGQDTISGFDGVGLGVGDRIDLSDLWAGTLTFRFGSFNGTGQVHVVEAGSGNSRVEVNLSGDLAPEFAILVQDGSALATDWRAVDFIL